MNIADHIATSPSCFYFRATFHFGAIGHTIPSKVVDFATLEEMEAGIRLERRRRKLSDRMTGGYYTLELTASGNREWNADSDGAWHGFRSRCKDQICRNIPLIRSRW